MRSPSTDPVLVEVAQRVAVPHNHTLSPSPSQERAELTLAPTSTFTTSLNSDFIFNSFSMNDYIAGVPWTPEEHKRFLLGLSALGKGDWRGISRH